MGCSVYALAEGIQAQVNATDNNQSAEAYFGITLAMSFLDLQQAWMKEIGKDNGDYVRDSLIVADGGKDPDVFVIDPKTHEKIYQPMSPARPAADNMKKMIASNNSNYENGKLNTLLETVKAKAQRDGNAMENVLKLQAPIIDLMSSLESLIKNMLK